MDYTEPYSGKQKDQLQTEILFAFELIRSHCHHVYMYSKRFISLVITGCYLIDRCDDRPIKLSLNIFLLIEFVNNRRQTGSPIMGFNNIGMGGAKHVQIISLALSCTRYYQMPVMYGNYYNTRYCGRSEAGF